MSTSPHAAVGMPSPGPRFPRCIRRTVLGALVVAAITGLALLLGLTFVAGLPFALPLAIVLVPAGLVYGVIIRIVLVVRRRRAVPDDGSRSTGSREAARFARPVQLAQVGVDVVLAVVGVLGAVAGAFEAAFPGSGSDTTALDRIDLALTLLLSGLVMLLIAAIPVSAAVATRQAFSGSLLRGEAAALRARTDAGRRIRRARTLSSTVFAVYALAAVAGVVLVTVVLPHLS